jgi:hypothetical protein
MTTERPDPMYKYVDGKIAELNNNLLLIQRRMAASNVTLVSFMSIVSLHLSDPQKFKTLSDKIKKETQDTIEKINKSANPLDVADKFIDDIHKWVF